jgi:isoleucyl-tRNA synthetase
MSLDGFDPSRADMEKIARGLLPEDRWLLSRINSLVHKVTQEMERYNLHLATRAIADFILEDLSRWYIKLIRWRVWIESEDPRKLAAYATLYQSLHVLIRLLAPFAPHITEVLYQELVRSVSPDAPESVHMLPWPAVDRKQIDTGLEEGMRMVSKFVEAAARLRQEAGLKLRWPIRAVVVKTDKKSQISELRELFRSQLNCKELHIIGPGEAPPIAMEEFRRASTEHGEIWLDARMTPELKSEALAREVVRRMQLMRKEMDLEMEERIDAVIGTNDREALHMLQNQQEYIKREVRIRNLRLCPLDEAPKSGCWKEWNIDGVDYRLVLIRPV